MRVKLYDAEDKAQALRITPAHAGKTLVPTPDAIVPEDHPRACG